MTSYGAIEVTNEEGQENGGGGRDDETTPLIKEAFFAEPQPSEIDKTNRNCWTRLTFRWFTSILHRGNENNRLEPEDLDLIPLPNDCETAHVSAVFDHYWKIEVETGDPSLTRALARAYGKDYFIAGCLKLVHDLCVFVGPQVLHSIIVFLRSPDAPPSEGLLLTLAVTASQIAMSFCLRHYFFKCYMTGLRIRTAVVLAVYKKALLLSAAERQTKTLGEITNLISIDASRLQDLMNYMMSLWSSPLQIVLALYFLWGELGPSSLGGVAVIIGMVPVTKKVAQMMGRVQKILMKAKDKRIELNSEVLSGMKVIKLQAWEEPFQKRILDLRGAELRQLLGYFVINAVSGMLWTLTPMAVAVASFGAYVLTGQDLDVATALTALALFDILRFPLAMLPRVINSVVEAGVSVKRIRTFLLSQEHKAIGPNNLQDTGIRLQTVSAAYDSKKPKVAEKKDTANLEELKQINDRDWEIRLLKSQLRHAEQHIRELSGGKVEQQQPQEVPLEDVAAENLLALKRIDFEVKAGELVAVVGGVGCGKSTFVNAMLGEVRELSGTTSVRGNLAYFSQNPFIMNASVRDNILFSHVSEPVDEELYQKALDCCALRHDLELLPHGDATEIGEKGITMSGGQRARVALARAVYHRGDITLIDDALSAVDAHVAEHLFEQAIVKEFMKSDGGKKRSVVLVTNAIQYLSHERVDKIVVIQDGRIAEQGSYKELAAKRDSIFARFLAVVDETGVSKDSMDDWHPIVDESVPEMPACASPEIMASSKRQSAVRRRSSAKEKEELKPQKLMTDESRAAGHVGLQVYLAWARASGGLWVPVVVLLAFAGDAAIAVLTKWWLTYWSSHGDSGRSQEWFLAIYALINLGSALFSLARQLFLAVIALIASRRLFQNMLASVLQAPMSFYDTTPVGRLVNRFSKDIYTIDEQLVNTFSMYTRTLFSVLSTVVVIAGVTPVFLLFLFPMILYYMKEQAFFTVSYRELKRLDSSTRSPLYALLGESVDGVAVIRAFAAEGSLTQRMTGMLNNQQHAYFLVCAAQSWLAVRLELVGTLVITFACLSAVAEHAVSGANEVFAGLAGLAISYALSVTQSLNWSVRMASDMEANMVAVERIMEYTELESEGDRHTSVDDALPASWPSGGEVLMKSAKLRYRPGLPLVLKGLDLDIPAGSKVGVVGRTGAGKSTLMVALLRVVELAEGKVIVDGQDVRKVGLAKLRSNIAVIPQDPVLYSGTVRTNLDPFDDFPDEKLYEVLDRVGLHSMASASMSSNSLSSLGRARVEELSDEVTEGGSNFSVGQRQLLVIARALLNGSKLVIMDEATAAVDAETDAAIQKVMRVEFEKATVITVAHRINTIMDSDFILVMSDGRAAEFDKPKTLLERGGLFRDLVEAAAHD